MEENDITLSKRDKWRYDNYIKFIISTGGCEDIVHLKAIRDIICTIIKEGNPIEKSLGQSVIYYRDANEDGTFDLCGRMEEPLADLVYMMEYCNDDCPDHFLLLTKYELVSAWEGAYYTRKRISVSSIIIDQYGQIVKQEDLEPITDVSQYDSLLSILQKKLVRKM